MEEEGRNECSEELFLKIVDLTKHQFEKLNIGYEQISKV
jgi:hypothetical protein